MWQGTDPSILLTTYLPRQESPGGCFVNVSIVIKLNVNEDTRMLVHAAAHLLGGMLAVVARGAGGTGGHRGSRVIGTMDRLLGVNTKRGPENETRDDI